MSEHFDVALSVEKRKIREPVRNADEVHLRSVDLNLLTVFDAVMQVQNITRAAESLGMSQPAVSNAVARLKVMFNDELFMRYGRGIQPTHRACQLFGPIRQALQLVQNELPGSGFNPMTSERSFDIVVSSPLDIRLTARLFAQVKERAENVQLLMGSAVNSGISRELRYQEKDFLISYNMLEGDDFICEPLFNDEFVLAVAKDHPRIKNSVTNQQLLFEQHAIVSLEQFSSLSKSYYENSEFSRCVAYQGTDMSSVLSLVSKTELVAIAPRWLAEEYAELLGLSVVNLMNMEKQRTCYLIWHNTSERDRGHQWMKSVLIEFGSQF
ncbi:transcriptional regulator LeuO [Enterobacillus tribolii]|uniref:LysR family transcriptional activator for leuABCD operon n=1 Tax=Enterobacillus tribolii TaxID=1487935 RepID=A0A370R1N3_9GAMM|nr:transcriptional regulator LeuO [Enterobacillus tribolii]MBW7983062.1 transcriptional regulator LeuO [Enterobacillus tribolii]RDK95833.1 LysR family transcriptional activator for leuABCD operon [Enterobacillus tribolii]